MFFFLLPPLFVIAIVLYWLCTGHVPSDELPMKLASDLINCVSEHKLWHDAIGDSSGMRQLYASTIVMLQEVLKRPDLKKTRDYMILMVFGFWLVTRWCLWVEVPLKALFPSLHRRAAWTSARIYCSIAATYAMALELDD